MRPCYGIGLMHDILRHFPGFRKAAPHSGWDPRHRAYPANPGDKHQFLPKSSLDVRWNIRLHPCPAKSLKQPLRTWAGMVVHLTESDEGLGRSVPDVARTYDKAYDPSKPAQYNLFTQNCRKL